MITVGLSVHQSFSVGEPAGIPPIPRGGLIFCQWAEAVARGATIPDLKPAKQPMSSREASGRTGSKSLLGERASTGGRTVSAVASRFVEQFLSAVL